MAKFLPFVVEKSTPIHIFQTLIQRSKGMNQVLVASIFYLVLANGITKIRKAASDIPDSDQDHVYEMLLTKFPNFRVSTNTYTRFKYIIPHAIAWYPKAISAELDSYEDDDKAIFYLVLALCEKSDEYTSLHFDRVIEGHDEEVFSNLKKYNLFNNDEDPYYLANIDDLRAYISARTVLKPNDHEAVPRPIKAVYSPPPKKNKGGNKSKKSKPQNDGASGRSFEEKESWFSQNFSGRPQSKSYYSKEGYEHKYDPGFPDWAKDLQRANPVGFEKVLKEFEEYKRFGGDPGKDPYDFFMKRLASIPSKSRAHDGGPPQFDPRKAFPKGSDPFDWKP